MDEGREQISPKRFFGIVLEWRGTFGWIMPNETVPHPLALMKGGKLYVAASDTDGGALKSGATVSFNVYEDWNGLGASKCKVVGSSSGKGAFETPKWMATLQGERQRVTQTRLSGIVRDKKPGSTTGWIKAKTPVKHKLYNPSKGLYFKEDDIVPQGTTLTPGMEVTFFVYTDGQGIGAEKVMEWKGTFMEPPKAKKDEKASWGKAKGKGKGKTKGPLVSAFLKMQAEAAKPSKKKLPRKRVSSEAMLGEVFEWKGTFGWITPEDPIEHPKLQKKGLYVRADDVLTGSLEKGQTVNFHVYEDASGLGAEECIQC